MLRHAGIFCCGRRGCGSVFAMRPRRGYTIIIISYYIIDSSFSQAHYTVILYVYRAAVMLLRAVQSQEKVLGAVTCAGKALKQRLLRIILIKHGNGAHAG